MGKSSQHLQVANHLEAMIAGGVLVAGAKIPSLRKLGEQFNMSVWTVRRGIDYLREKGTLTIRQGSGVYVADRKNGSVDTAKTKYKIAVFVATDDLSNSYCAHALHGVQSVAGSDCSLIVNIHDYNNEECSIDYSSIEDAASESDAMLFIGCYDRIVKKLPQTKPCVGVEVHSSYSGLMSTIALDPLNAAELACNFFNEHGYKKVKVLSFPMPVYRFRAMAFSDLWREFGEVEEVCTQKPVGLDYISDPETAYFFTSDTEYNYLAKSYRESTGKALVDERCILSIDGKSLLIPNYEPINTIAVDWKEMGVMAFEECIRRIDNPGIRSRRIYQNCYLQEKRK